MKIISISFSFLLFICSLFYIFDIGFNTTISLPKGIYIKSNEEIKHGSLVKFCLQDTEHTEFIEVAQEFLSNGMCENNLKPLLKIVAGMPHDYVEIKEKGIYITPKDKEIACFWECEIKETDSQGKKLPKSLLKTGIIPENKILVLTPHKDSFDSRYYGLVDINSTSHFIDIFTF